MAPDISTLPLSPRSERMSQPSSHAASATISRRTSMLPPTLPASASHSAIQSAQRSPLMPNHEQIPGVPLRHPRPLTATELYLECEKEQEAVVNRLTRELTALRAQSASVASNASASSTSTGVSQSILPIDITDPNPTHQIIGSTHPTPSRRARSSSSVSGRSLSSHTPSLAAATSNTNASAQAHAAHPASMSQASVDRAVAASGTVEHPTNNRQASHNASGTSTPARRSMDLSRGPSTSHLPQHRPSLSRDISHLTISSTAAQPGTPASTYPHPLPSPAPSPGPREQVAIAMQHYAETAAYRSEMEIVKAENEALRQRVRALERALRARRRDSSQSDAARPDLNRAHGSSEGPNSSSGPALRSMSSSVAIWASASDGGIGGVAGPRERERSESQSTTASSRRPMLGVPPEDDVKVGESAASSAGTTWR